MFNSIKDGFFKGIRQIKENPQLAYTILTAVIIFFAFLFVSNNFLLIAKDAQDRLVNVRIGAMHDVLVKFIPEKIERPDDLSEKMEDIAKNNETILDFRIVSIEDGQKKIISSINREEIGTLDRNNDFLYNLAIVKPDYSLTVEDFVDNERVFTTIRAITNKDNDVVGAIYTSQSLSQADKNIGRGIINGIITLIVILVVIMALFFRFAKVIDYTVLYRRLKEIDKMKDDFISMATHELRTPLTIVRGYVEFLKSSKNINEEDNKIIDNIDLHSKRLSLLIDDILLVPKIEQGKMDLVMEKFNPEKEIVETTESFSFIAKEKGLTITSCIQGSSTIVADKVKFRQVLVNIIGNSIKYTKKGKIEIKTSVDKDRLIIRISDTGIGMSAEEQKGLFQKFYRIRTKDTEDITGTGLGLWITLKLLEAMGGKLSVESIKGVGTHMILSFPVVENSIKN